MFQGLNQLISSFGFEDEEELRVIQSQFRYAEFKKGEYLVQEGDICTELGFIIEGYFRVFIVKDVDENTVHIAGNNDFIASFSSFISRSPSFEYVQALTNAKVLMLSKEGLETLYNTSPKIERLGRVIIESLFVRKENRVIDFIRNSAQERYEGLIQNDPELINNVPLHYIASYLGVKPETLSRIRAKK